MIKVTDKYYVLSQKNWASKSLRSSPLSKELAERIRVQLLDRGYRVATLVRVATVVTN